MPEPNDTNNWGGFAGVEGPAAEAEPDASADGSVYTAVGNDERARRANTFPFYALQQFPTRVNGAMSSNGNTMSGGCSGAKVGPRAVLTASHCVYNPLTGAWTTSGFFNPGQTNTTTPNGSHAWAGVYARDYIANGRQDDYAVFFVNDSSAFYNLGWLGIGWSTDPAFYSGMNAKNRGYPCGPNLGCGMISTQRCADSARSDLRCDGWMYGMDIPLPSDAFWPNNLLAYHNDVSFGHSGSAIYDNNSAVLGIVTHQESQPGCNSNNVPPCPWYLPCHGPRFRQAMWDDVCSWIADPNFQSAHGQHPICHW